MISFLKNCYVYWIFVSHLNSKIILILWVNKYESLRHWKAVGTVVCNWFRKCFMFDLTFYCEFEIISNLLKHLTFFNLHIDALLSQFQTTDCYIYPMLDWVAPQWALTVAWPCADTNGFPSAALQLYVLIMPGKTFFCMWRQKVKVHLDLFRSKYSIP